LSGTESIGHKGAVFGMQKKKGCRSSLAGAIPV
jgi:hypothetical protein